MHYNLVCQLVYKINCLTSEEDDEDDYDYHHEWDDDDDHDDGWDDDHSSDDECNVLYLCEFLDPVIMGQYTNANNISTVLTFDYLRLPAEFQVVLVRQ